MKYLVVAGPAYGKTSLVKGLNKLSGELIAADLDCKGLKPPYANEGILTRCVCDVFDCGYSVVTVHPSACNYDDVIQHCHSKNEDIRVVFAVENWNYMLRYPLARIGRRDGYDSSFFHHMCSCYLSIMDKLLNDAWDARIRWGDEVVSVVRMRGSVLTNYFGWSATTHRVCFGVPESNRLTAGGQFIIDKELSFTEDDIIEAGNWFISTHFEQTPFSTKQLLLLCCKSEGFRAALSRAEQLTCFVYPASEQTEDDCDEETSFIISPTLGRCIVNWKLKISNDGTSWLHSVLYLPNNVVNLIKEDSGISFDNKVL